MVERETRPVGIPGRRNDRPVIGFVLSQEQFRIDELVELAPLAERAGFGAVWASDHFQPWQDNQGHVGQAWVTLSAAGQRTERALLGTGVTCPTFRYRPAIVAEAFASLGILYPGRVFLGVGTGEALNEVPSGGGWASYKERDERLVEAIEIIRQLWAGEPVSYQGRHFTIQNARLYDVPAAPVPIYVAAGGEESMRTAGKHGDGLVTDSQVILEPKMREAFAEGARSAGKNPDDLALVAEHWVSIKSREGAAKDAELWRFMPKAWTDFVENPDPTDIQRQAEQKVSIDEVLQKWVVSEDPEEHVTSLQKLLDGGVTHVFVHSAQADQRAFIEFYGSKVLPHVRTGATVR